MAAVAAAIGIGAIALLGIGALGAQANKNREAEQKEHEELKQQNEDLKNQLAQIQASENRQDLALNQLLGNEGMQNQQINQMSGMQNNLQLLMMMDMLQQMMNSGPDVTNLYMQQNNMSVAGYNVPQYMFNA